ncbi:unnamed protein product [Caenorhabditis auriculariae]|uniref:Uncharacterized protein n=1 Tax=Caenorhabditis auriculariae TaxID=2777116 RepID=A0A8S1HQC0_9PELO|nr:unnamed protein product [Caenorhabditis auriculariae]
MLLRPLHPGDSILFRNQRRRFTVETDGGDGEFKKTSRLIAGAVSLGLVLDVFKMFLSSLRSVTRGLPELRNARLCHAEHSCQRHHGQSILTTHNDGSFVVISQILISKDGNAPSRTVSSLSHASESSTASRNVAFFLAATTLQRLVDIFYGDSRVSADLLSSEVPSRRVSTHANLQDQQNQSASRSYSSTLTQEDYNASVDGRSSVGSAGKTLEPRRDQKARVSERSNGKDGSHASRSYTETGQSRNTSEVSNSTIKSAATTIGIPNAGESVSTTHGIGSTASAPVVTVGTPGGTTSAASETKSPMSSAFGDQGAAWVSSQSSANKFVANFLSSNPIVPPYVGASRSRPKSERMLALLGDWLFEIVMTVPRNDQSKRNGDVADETVPRKSYTLATSENEQTRRFRTEFFSPLPSFPSASSALCSGDFASLATPNFFHASLSLWVNRRTGIEERHTFGPFFATNTERREDPRRPGKAGLHSFLRIEGSREVVDTAGFILVLNIGVESTYFDLRRLQSSVLWIGGELILEEKLVVLLRKFDLSRLQSSVLPIILEEKSESRVPSEARAVVIWSSSESSYFRNELISGSTVSVYEWSSAPRVVHFLRIRSVDDVSTSKVTSSDELENDSKKRTYSEILIKIKQN